MSKKKLKINPSQKDNRRYFFMNSDDRVKIEEAIFDYIGILGHAKSNFMFLEKDGKLIGSCTRESLNNIRASLSWKGISIQKVSGTIAGLFR